MSRDMAVGLTPGAATARPRVVRVARKVGVGLAAALVAGVAMGALARLMMRLTAVAAGHPGEFSLAGTAGILLAFVIVTAPGALLASLVRRRGRSALLVVGTLLLGANATAIAIVDLNGVGDLSAFEWAGVALAIAGIYVAIIALPVLTLRLIRRWSRD